MAEPKVYGSLESAATRKVLALLFELDLHFNFIPIDVEGGQNLQEPFLSLSPFGELPVYEAGGISLSEYGAILRSVAHQYSKEGEYLICWDTKEQALVANWVDVEDNHFRPAATKLLDALKENSDTIVGEAEQKMVKVLDVYESQLTNKNYLVMDKYTIADVAHLPYLHSLMDRPDTRKLILARPCVKSWAATILARPAWTKVLQMHTLA